MTKSLHSLRIPKSSLYVLGKIICTSDIIACRRSGLRDCHLHYRILYKTTCIIPWCKNSCYQCHYDQALAQKFLPWQNRQRTILYKSTQMPGIQRQTKCKQGWLGLFSKSFALCIYQLLQKKTFYCNDHKITEFGITDKNSSTAYIVLYKGIDTWFLDSNRRVGVWSLPWRWHILSIPLTTGRGTSAETCGLDDVFPPDDLGYRPETLC